MNKKWMIVIISFLLMAAIIGAGGKIYMDKKAEQKEAEKIEVERKSVEALKESYTSIKSVEFEKSVYDKVTGAYVMFIKMTNQSNKSVNFRYTFWSKENEIGSARLENEDVQRKGNTKGKVKVIYSNEDEDEV